MPSGGAYNNYLGQQLLLFAMKGLLTRTGMDLNLPDYVIGGTVIQEGERNTVTTRAVLRTMHPNLLQPVRETAAVEHYPNRAMLCLTEYRSSYFEYCARGRSRSGIAGFHPSAHGDDGMHQR